LNAEGSALIYSTYLGGSGNNDNSGAIAVDASGNAYVIGHTDSTDFPTTPGAFATTFAGGASDVLVTKLNTTGSALMYSTFLGGSGSDMDWSSAIDAVANANAYVIGHTDSTDFPTTLGALDTTFNGAADVFVAKLGPTGSALIYSTFLGGSGYDQGLGIAL